MRLLAFLVAVRAATLQEGEQQYAVASFKSLVREKVAAYAKEFPNEIERFRHEHVDPSSLAEMWENVRCDALCRIAEMDKKGRAWQKAAAQAWNIIKKDIVKECSQTLRIPANAVKKMLGEIAKSEAKRGKINRKWGNKIGKTDRAVVQYTQRTTSQRASNLGAAEGLAEIIDTESEAFAQDRVDTAEQDLANYHGEMEDSYDDMEGQQQSVDASLTSMDEGLSTQLNDNTDELDGFGKEMVASTSDVEGAQKTVIELEKEATKAHAGTEKFVEANIKKTEGAINVETKKLDTETKVAETKSKKYLAKMEATQAKELGNMKKGFNGIMKEASTGIIAKQTKIKGAAVQVAIDMQAGAYTTTSAAKVTFEDAVNRMGVNMEKLEKLMELVKELQDTAEDERDDVEKSFKADGQKEMTAFEDNFNDFTAQKNKVAAKARNEIKKGMSEEEQNAKQLGMDFTDRATEELATMQDGFGEGQVRVNDASGKLGQQLTDLNILVAENRKHILKFIAVFSELVKNADSTKVLVANSMNETTAETVAATARALESAETDISAAESTIENIASSTRNNVLGGIDKLKKEVSGSVGNVQTSAGEALSKIDGNIKQSMGQLSGDVDAEAVVIGDVEGEQKQIDKEFSESRGEIVGDQRAASERVRQIYDHIRDTKDVVTKDISASSAELNKAMAAELSAMETGTSKELSSQSERIKQVVGGLEERLSNVKAGSGQSSLEARDRQERLRYATDKSAKQAVNDNDVAGQNLGLLEARIGETKKKISEATKMETLFQKDAENRAGTMVDTAFRDRLHRHAGEVAQVTREVDQELAAFGAHASRAVAEDRMSFKQYQAAEHKKKLKG